MMWKRVADNIGKYKSYPRLVGETGGKDFILAHASADPKALATAIIRGGYEYQGQKCSAASRVYVAQSVWDEDEGRAGLRDRHDQGRRRLRLLELHGRGDQEGRVRQARARRSPRRARPRA